MKCNCCSILGTNFRASISDKEIDDLKNTKQHFSDCYLMTSLESLSHTKNGRKILKDKIHHDDKNPFLINCYLYDPNGKQIKYTIPTNAVVNGYNKLYKLQKNDIIRSMDISVSEYEKKYKAKPLICRFTDNFKSYEFENNLPSHFLKIFTGKEPTINIAEQDINIDLSNYREEVMNLFEKMSKNKNYNLLIGTGVKMLNGRSWHVYILENVDLENNTVTVKEKRSNKPQTMSIESALNTFKYIVGYFDSDLNNV